MAGMGRYLLLQTNLWLALLGALVTCAVCFGIGKAAEQLVAPTSLVLLPIFIIFSVALMFILAVVPIRVINWCSKNIPQRVKDGFLLTVVIVWIGGGLISMVVANDYSFLVKFLEDTWSILPWALLGAGVLLVILVLSHVVRNPVGTWEGLKTVTAFIRAKKQKVCPLVEPPDSWSNHS